MDMPISIGLVLFFSTQGTNEKEKSLLGGTFSMTKRRPKGETRIGTMTGRNSLDFKTRQGELHAGESTFFIPMFFCVS